MADRLRLSKSGDAEVWTRPLSGGAQDIALFNRGAEAAKITIKMYALSPELIFPHSGLKYRPSRHAIKSLGLGRRVIYLVCGTLDVSRALVVCAVCYGNAHSVPDVAKTIR